MTYEVKRIDVWSVVKIAFILGGIFGLLAGILYAMMLAMIGGFLSQLGGEFGAMPGLTGAVGIVTIFFMVLFYAVVGAVITAIFTWMYNLLAKGMGGIRFNLEQEKTKVVIQPLQKTEAESEGMLGNQKYE
ncbi:MAG: hypothetical protein AMJ91_06885 [candidate division Zixibacteria bacterium SM23_73_3]|nr:MAG: hypothetical protein AMJ91_06885 [candidate division Zixibacteria bacterium SM23_73_3]